MKRIALFVATFGLLQAVGAQNLVQNPNFDTDATGWDLSMYSTWSDRVDHENSPYSGALQITTRTEDFAQQCIEVRGSTNYVFSAWVEKDPQASIAPCDSPYNTISIDIRDAAQCAGETTLSYSTGIRIPELDGWQHQMVEVTTDASSRSALVTLQGACRNSGSGISIHYFDDILFAPDEILHTDFEVHAPENGPGQPPG